MLLENVKVTGINPGMPNIKIGGMDEINHVESISLMYERITWRDADGNIKFTDAWDER